MTKPFSIQNLLAGKLSAGVNVFLGISGCQADRIDEFIAQQLPAIRSAHARSLPPGFAASRRLFNSLHIDPTRHRPSAEALWRRLRDKNDFPRVNPLVDLTNLLSLKFQISFGLYDLEQLQCPVVIALGNANDQYLGIRKETLNFNGKIVLRDAHGAFGNPSADSLRASVSEKSLDIVQILFFLAGDDLQETVLTESATCFTRFFALKKAHSFLLKTDDKQGIAPEGETCKTYVSQTKSPSPA